MDGMSNMTGHEASGLDAAMVKAMAMMISPRKNRKAGGGSKVYWYTTLSEINDMIREPLAANGLYPSHSIQGGNPILVVTSIRHASGATITSEMPIKQDGSNPQAFGSAVTYAKRYNLCALLNIASDEDDDDAAAAMNHRKPHPDQEPQRDKVEHVLAERFRRMVGLARSIQDAQGGHDLMKMWQRDMGEFMAMRDQPERAAAWATMLADVPKGLDTAFGMGIGAAWRDAILANTKPEFAKITAAWNGPLAATVSTMRTKHPQAYTLLNEHMRAQGGRVDAAHVEQEIAAEEPEPGFRAVLMDEYGEPASQEGWESAAAFARAYSNLLLGSSNPDALEQHNGDALAACFEDHEASEILAEAGSPPPMKSVAIEQVPLAKNRQGNPDLTGYLTAVRAAVAGLDKTSVEPWVALNAPIYGELPQGTKMQVLKAIATRRAELGVS